MWSEAPPNDDDAPDPDDFEKLVPAKPTFKSTFANLSDDVRLVRDFLSSCTPPLARITFPSRDGDDAQPMAFVLLETARKIITVKTYEPDESKDFPLIWAVSHRGLWTFYSIIIIIYTFLGKEKRLLVYTVGVSLQVRSSCCFQMCVQPCCPEFVFKCFAPPLVLESCAHDVCWTCLVSCSVKHVCVARVEFNLFRSPLLFSIHNCLYHFVFNIYCYIYITYWNWRRSAYPPRKDILIKTDCRILIRIIRCIPRTKMEFQQCIWIWYYSYHNTWYTNNWNLCNISWRLKYKMA